jgi:hypothetical protein
LPPQNVQAVPVDPPLELCDAVPPVVVALLVVPLPVAELADDVPPPMPPPAVELPDVPDDPSPLPEVVPPELAPVFACPASRTSDVAARQHPVDATRARTTKAEFVLSQLFEASFGAVELQR